MEPELVAVQLPSGPDLVTALDRVWAAKGAILPLAPGLPEAQTARILEALRPSRYIGAGPSRPVTRRLRGGRPVRRGTALVVATSGSTGTPKGVELSRAALDHSVAASIERLECRRRERWLACLPLHHVAGVQVLLRSRALGTDPVVHPRFDVGAIDRERRAQHVSLVPTQLVRLLDAGVDLSRFTTVLLGGGPVPPGLRERAAAAGVRLVESYGMTETCGGCVYDGVPLRDVEVAVGEDGRIAVSGPVLMDGYRLRPDLTAQALAGGWLHTADVGRWRDGRLEVLGRADDVIVTGGENVAAEQVAARLREHPALRDAAVLGRPDDEWGQVVVAVCVPADPARPPTLADLRDHVRATLPAHAAPRGLVVVPSLPRDGMGKISRPALAALAAQATDG